MVGIDGDLGVVEVDAQCLVPLQGVVQGLGEGVARQQGGALDLALGPGEEGVDQGLGVGQAIVAFGRAGQALRTDLGLDAVEGTDALQGLGTGRGLDVFGPLEVAAGVCLIWISR